MKKRRKDYGGCAVEPHQGWFRLRFRVRLPDGRISRVSRQTGLAVSAENAPRARALAATVTGGLRAGRTLAELDEVLRLLVPRVEEATPPAAPVPHTVRSYYEEWIAEQAPLVRKAQARVYRKDRERHVLPELGDLLLRDLKPKDIRGLQAELLAKKATPRQGQEPTGKTLSVKTVKNILCGTFQAMIRAATIDEEVTRPLFIGLTWPTHETPDPDPFTLAEVRRILTWFQTKVWGMRRRPHPAYHVYLHLLFWAGGLRPSEASGLQWQDIDLRRGLLYVRRSYHLRVYDGPKFPGAKRTVELLPETVRLLRTIYPLHPTPEMPVFTTTTGTPINPTSFAENWYRCLRACGIRERGLYCTKDTFVTEGWRTMGLDWVSAQTGVDHRTLKKHYAKWKPDPSGEALRRWAALYERADENSDVSDVAPETSDVAPDAEKTERYQMRGGGLEPPRVLPH